MMVAQVANVVGPGGVDHGWVVWMYHDHEELGRYRTEREAMAAAEAAWIAGLGPADAAGNLTHGRYATELVPACAWSPSPTIGGRRSWSAVLSRRAVR